MSYSWPGNVRELENEMKRLVAMTWRRTITEDDLSETIRRGGRVSPPPASSLKETVAEIEKRMILEALQACRHNQQRAARMLGLSRQGLIKKMKRYGITESVEEKP